MPGSPRATRPAPLTVLADSGPFVALYNNKDRHHQRALDFFRAHGAALRLQTTWEVISEVMYFLDFSAQVQGDFLDWLYAGHQQGLVTPIALNVRSWVDWSWSAHGRAKARVASVVSVPTFPRAIAGSIVDDRGITGATHELRVITTSLEDQGVVMNFLGIVLLVLDNERCIRVRTRVLLFAS